MTDVPRNRVTWFQIPADDVPRAQAFYGSLFGWRPQDAITDRKMTGAINGNIAERSASLQEPRLVIRVDDVDAAAAAAVDAGGRQVTRPQLIEEIGMTFAVIGDTEGNLLNVVSMPEDD